VLACSVSVKRIKPETLADAILAQANSQSPAQAMLSSDDHHDLITTAKLSEYRDHEDQIIDELAMNWQSHCKLRSLPCLTVANRALIE
jgi:hypothetical protein